MHRIVIGMVAAGLLLIAAQSQADPFTHDRRIGFSEDGDFFAFETFGLQRGSGLPFSNIFVVDLKRNEWASGTPIRSSMDEMDMAKVEEAPFAALEETRRNALLQASGVLRDLRLRRPGTILYAAGIGQAHQETGVRRIDIPNPDDPTRPPMGYLELSLETFPATGGSENCMDPGALRGFKMVVIPQQAAPEIIHNDRLIPASRGCPTAYRLDAVLSAGYPQPGSTLVAMISVWRQGFEGKERHLIAVPVPMR